jgi:septum formation protein
MTKYPLILASESKHRKVLLETIGFYPDLIIPSNIDETPMPREKPNSLVKRLAIEKVTHASKKIDNGFIIGGDTIIWINGKILGKAYSSSDVRDYLKLYSGRRISIYTAIAAAKVENFKVEKIISKTVISKVKFKRLTEEDIEWYISSKEGIDLAGGIKIDGKASCLISWISGSTTAIIGLPTYEASIMLKGLGYKPT